MIEWNGDGRTVLIADGDLRFRRAARRALGAAGLDVSEAGSGEEALARAGEGDSALVVLDVLPRLQRLRGVPAASGDAR